MRARSSYLEYATRTALRLPFDGDWYVVWGGRTIGQIGTPPFAISGSLTIS